MKDMTGLKMTPEVAKHHIIALYAGKGYFRKKDIIQVIEKRHIERGGMPTKSDINSVTKKALIDLRKEGYAEQPSPKSQQWRIREVEDENIEADDPSNYTDESQELVIEEPTPDDHQVDSPFDSDEPASWAAVPILNEIGGGDQSVYLCFYDHHKRLAQASSEEFDSSLPGMYPCKIGMSTRSSPFQRLQGLLRLTWHSPFTFGFVYRCDDAYAVEKYLHGQLAIRGRSWRVPGDGGTEWFLTTEEEVIEFIHTIQCIQN